MLQKLSKLNKLFVEHKLTKSFGADVFVFELVIGCIRVDHNPLYAVTAKLLLIKTKKKPTHLIKNTIQQSSLLTGVQNTSDV